MLAGETVVIVGGGPSHVDLDFDLLKRHRFIAINSACRYVRPIARSTDILYFSDNSWHENRPELAAEWPGLVVTGNRRVKARVGAAVHYLDVTSLTAFMRTRADDAQASSGHVAACMAAWLGAARIVLTGCECKAVNGRTHGHNDYQNHNPSSFGDRFLPGWRGLAPAFARLGVDVVNATPGSAIDVYPTMPFAEAVAA